MAFLDHSNAVIVKVPEVVACVTGSVRLDSYKCKVFNDGILKFLFLFRGVGIIKAKKQCPLIKFMCKIIVQERRLGVTNVKVSTIRPVSLGLMMEIDGASYDGSGGNLVTTPFSTSCKARL